MFTPTTEIQASVNELVAEDAARLADPLDAPLVTLIIDPFVPSLDTLVAGLVPATFTGSAPKSATAGDQQFYNNPVDSSRVVQLDEPVGGWQWICTVAPGAPETVYGYVITNQAGTVTYGSELLETPVVISAVGDGVNLGVIRASLPFDGWNA